MFIFFNFFNSLALSFYTLTIAYCEYANAYTIEIILYCTSKLYKASLVCSLYILRVQSNVMYLYLQITVLSKGQQPMQSFSINSEVKI